MNKTRIRAAARQLGELDATIGYATARRAIAETDGTLRDAAVEAMDRCAQDRAIWNRWQAAISLPDQPVPDLQLDETDIAEMAEQARISRMDPEERREHELAEEAARVEWEIRRQEVISADERPAPNVGLTGCGACATRVLAVAGHGPVCTSCDPVAPAKVATQAEIIRLATELVDGIAADALRQAVEQTPPYELTTVHQALARCKEEQGWWDSWQTALSSCDDLDDDAEWAAMQESSLREHLRREAMTEEERQLDDIAREQAELEWGLRRQEIIGQDELPPCPVSIAACPGGCGSKTLDLLGIGSVCTSCREPGLLEEIDKAFDQLESIRGPLAASMSQARTSQTGRADRGRSLEERELSNLADGWYASVHRCPRRGCTTITHSLNPFFKSHELVVEACPAHHLDEVIINMNPDAPDGWERLSGPKIQRLVDESLDRMAGGLHNRLSGPDASLDEIRAALLNSGPDIPLIAIDAFAPEGPAYAQLVVCPEPNCVTTRIALTSDDPAEGYCDTHDRRGREIPDTSGGGPATDETLDEYHQRDATEAALAAVEEFYETHAHSEYREQPFA